MSSDDPRKDYLAKLILDQLVVGGEGLADGEEDFLDQLSGDKALQASLVQKGGGVDIRLSAGVLMPLLKKSVRDDPGVTALMNDLEASLGRMVRGNRGSRADVDINNVAGILTLQDELDFWLELRDDRYSAQRETIPDSLSKIQQNLAIDSSVDDDTFTEMLDDSVEILDSIGDDGYPKARMAHLLKLVGDRVIEFMRERVAEKSIWKTSFAAADRELNSTKSICEFWRKTTVSRGCKDPRLDGLLERLGKLLQLRKTQDAIKDLLSDDEQRLLLSDTAKALEGSEIKALQVNTHSMNSWKGALSEYNVAMKPVLQKVEEKVKTNFEEKLLPAVQAAVQELEERKRDVTNIVEECGQEKSLVRMQVSRSIAHPYQLLKDFSKYMGLLVEPEIASKLTLQRGKLAKMLEQYVQIIRGIADKVADGLSPANTQNLSGKNLSSIANILVFTSQLEHKVAQIKEAVHPILQSDDFFKEGDHFFQATDGLIQDLRRKTRKNFQDWEDKVKQEKVALDTTGKVMSFDKDGKLVVHYSDDLVNLLRQARQLCAIGYKIPKDVDAQLNKAQKLYHSGTRLKQVAGFYNRIGEEIVESQKKLLLKEASDFEEKVQDGGKSVNDDKPITWENPDQLDKYIDQLKSAMDRLTQKNRNLQRAHESLSDIVVQLMGTDLVRQQEQWKKKIGDMRAIIKQFDNETIAGKPAVQDWVHHWDHQLFKALDFQYKQGLESCHEILSDMEAKLKFSEKDKKLVFEPTFEEIRQAYYKKLSVFIDIPRRFKGVDLPGVSGSDIFSQIIARNAQAQEGEKAGLVVVFQQAEKLFKKLADFAESQSSWAALGCIDNLQKFVETKMTAVEDYEYNFRTLRMRQADANKLPSEKRIDCIKVDATEVTTKIKGLLDDFHKALCKALIESARSDMEELQKWVDGSLEALDFQVQSADDMRKARKNFGDILEQFQKKKDLKSTMESKCRLITSQRESAPDTAELMKSWDDLELRFGVHQDKMNEQHEQAKANMGETIKRIRGEITGFASRWKDFQMEMASAGSTDGDGISQRAERVAEYQAEWAGITEKAEECKRDCAMFQLPEPSFAELDSIQVEFEKAVASFALYQDYKKDMAEHTEKTWLDVRDRLHEVEDCLAKWAKNLTGRTDDAVVREMHLEIDRLRKNVPFLKFVKGEGFTQDHWSKLFELLIPKGADMRSKATAWFGLEEGQVPKGTDEIKKKARLQLFLDNSHIVAGELAEFKNLQARALAEMTIREAFAELVSWGIDATFTLLEHKDSSAGKVVPLIKEWKDVLTQVGDHQAQLQAMRDSPYFQKFAAEADDWDKKLSTLGIGLNDLNSVQRKWLYLEPIFGRGALPHEQPRFKKVDDEFREIMFEIRKEPRVVEFAGISRVCEKLARMIEQLDRCQKALSDFLEQKRSKFPRFYFVGDDDLLEILGQSQNPTVIQTHLKKLFQAIFKVEFSEDMKTITAFRSLEGEKVDLLSPVEITQTVEEWLANLATQMVQTLEQELSRCLRKFEEGTLAIREFPSMILCAAEQIRFCKDAESMIGSGSRGLSSLEDSMREKLASYTSTVLGDDYPVEKLKLKAIILDVIHNVDVCAQLQQNQVQNRSDWYWHKQLRFYVKHDTGKCFIKMCDAENAYTYEYQGNDPKLVHTPLTDKCFLTLTQALHLGYGGNPYGPAGTGKTESVKALGQALARQVLVFNCDEGIDFKSMGRIFTGLVKCGAWGCFDEFNRLEPEVLSAVSQQIQTIQAALKERSPELNLLGMKIDVNPNSGIFVTLNPAGKGYGGRSELPDNLKQLFRSVAMAAPDNALIGEVILYAEGYKEAKIVGTKVVELFTLSRQLLSKQQHYDWGLRALKTILLISGNLIQMEKKKPNASIDLKTEMELVIKAVRLNTLAKLTYADTVRFEALIKDIFPNSFVQDAVYETLEASIRDSLAELKLDLLPSQVKKVVQLNENLNQRMGCVIVGPSGCGKSTLLRILRAALSKMGQSVVVHTMNPKAMPRQQLLGHMDLDTREWFDGVLTASARQVVKEPPNVRSWIICDGDIDPEWVESLNSVLDDNRLLTMPSGERIRFGPNVNFIFETNDLRFASPATVSRMGMIFLSDEDMQTSCLLKAWVNKQPEAQRADLTQWLDELFDKGLNWVFGRVKDLVVDTTKVGLVLNALSHLVGSTCKEQFVVSLIRGLGSNMPSETRTKLALELFQLANERPLSLDDPLATYYDAETKVLKEHAGEENQELTAQDMRMTSPTDRDLPVVTTKDVRKCTDLFDTWLQQSEPFLLVGPEGCGKSMLLRNAFRRLKNADVAVVNCNAQTTAIHVIQKLQQSCTLATAQAGRVYRPKAERLILYLKDINLPKPDKYDTMQLIAFLQQLILYQGFYDGLEWIAVERVQIVCSMNPSTTVGRHKLTTRFTAILRIASIGYPERAELQSVYAAYLKAVVTSRVPGHPTWSDRKAIERLAGTLLDLYDNMREAFTVDDYRHYLFTPRDITTVVVGCLRYNLAEYHVLDVLTYEAQRVFRDRLVGDEAQRQFDGPVWDNLLRSTWSHKSNLRDTFFTTWFSEQPDSEQGEDKGQDGKMLVSNNTEDLTGHVQQQMQIYARENKELEMRLFPEIVERIARLDRILAVPGGSVLMIGRPGVGRRSCTQIACFMKKSREGTPMQIFSPNVGRGYGAKHFMNDLKLAVTAAGVHGAECALYLEDYQLAEPAFLEIVNSLLSSGEVPGMFAPPELDALLGPLKEEFSAAGFAYKNCYAFFVSRVQKNLHVILSLDPTHPDFGLRCESNPALYSRCNIMWLDSWSKTGMLEVPKMMLQETLKTVPNADRMVQNMHMLHESMATHSVAPRQYCTLLQTIGSLYQDKKAELDGQRNFLGGGLSKLAETWATVEKLSAEAKTAEQVLNDKQSEATKKMGEIKVNMEEAGRSKSEAEELSKKLKVDEVKMEERKAEVDDQLKDCMPVLESAKMAVSGIKKDNLNEIRSLKLPPEPIRDVLEGVLRLMNNQDTSWISMKRFLAQPSIISEIMEYDAKNITPEIREGVKNLLKTKKTSFEESTIARVSQAAAPMAAWVKAQIQYSLVLQTIKPLTDELDKLNDKLRKGTERYEECTERIRLSDETVKRLQDEHEQLTNEAAELKFELKKTKEVLVKAESLVIELQSEKERWSQQMRGLDAQMERLPTTLLVAASFITYLGAMPEDARRSMTDLWCRSLFKTDDVPGNGAELPEFHFMLMMSTETERLEWKQQGLPSDDLSAENAIIITKSTLYPLIIDPTTQASKWLSNFLAGQNAAVEVTTQQDDKFIQKLELSVRFGKTLVIEEVDRLEPLIIPLLRRDLIKQGARNVVHIGDKLVDFSDQFRLYLVTRNSNIEIPPDASPLVTAVNFSVTRSGLEGQLLGVTIQHEQPELEKKKSELLEKEERMKVDLSRLEKDLLEQLASSQGNILENTALIQKLSEIKTSSTEITRALDESSRLQQTLNEEREVYRDFARTASNVFFLIQGLKALNSMYQFDLPTYLNLFKGTLEGSKSGGDGRMGLMELDLKKNVFQFFARSLFKADRLTFATHLVRGIRPAAIAADEWNFFVGLVVTDASKAAGRVPEWVPPDRVAALQRLAATMPGLVQQLKLDSVEWSDWLVEHKPETPALFPKCAGNMKEFQRMLVVQALRPDRLQTAMEMFSYVQLGLKSLNLKVLDYGALAREASPQTPIMFIITPGADPSELLQSAADKVLGPGRYLQLAMGQGQSEAALRMLHNGSDKDGPGLWVCLQNVHLVVSWLPVIEKTLHSFEGEVNADFRLWLTTETHPHFPPILLQQSLKVTFEAPPGLKMNLHNACEMLHENYISRQGDAPGAAARAQLLFVVAWFHAVVQERRTFIPQGWSKFHEFSYADLRSTADIVTAIDNPANPPWETLHGLLDNAIYGGRIDNEFDQRILRTALHTFYASPSLCGRPVPYTQGQGVGRSGAGIVLPEGQKKQEMLAVIGSLPDVDKPALLGLPPNIERVLQQANSARLTGQLKVMATADVAAAGWDREVMAEQMQPLLTLWQTITSGNSALKPSNHGLVVEKAEPVDSFVAMEADAALKLVGMVAAALSASERVLRGVDLLTPDVRAVTTALAAGKVPAPWDAKWEGPDSPALWLQAVVKKKRAIDEWLAGVRSGATLARPVALADMFNPQVFLNALRQQTSRISQPQVAVDDLKLVCVWGDAGGRSLGPLPCALAGLSLQGALFTAGGTLSEARPETPTVVPLPVCTIAYIAKDLPDPQADAGSVVVPIYEGLDRSKILAKVRMPCKSSEQSKWIMAGTAIFASAE